MRWLMKVVRKSIFLISLMEWDVSKKVTHVCTNLYPNYDNQINPYFYVQEHIIPIIEQ
jgi:hypothetical protein